MPRTSPVELTPALAGYLLALIEVDNGENAPRGVRSKLDAFTDQLAAISRGA